MNVSIRSKRYIEHDLRQDELACRIVYHLDEAIDEIPRVIEMRLALIRTQVLQRRFDNENKIS